MYTREITDLPRKFVKHGKPVFGTFSGTPEKLDIRGVRRPFGGFPLPSVFTNFRIKSDIVFTFNIGEYIGTIEFFDAKIFGFAEVVFWEKKSGKKYSYRSFMGPRRRFIPHNLKAGYCASYKKSRYIRISWDREQDKISVIFNLLGDSIRPDVHGAFLGTYSDSNFGEITNSCPAYSKNRCSLTYTANFLINGSVLLGKTKFTEAIEMKKCNGVGSFAINRMYYNYLNEMEYIYASGETGGKKISFRISMKQSEIDADNYNDNVLFVDGVPTPLPSVLITHPEGVAGFENKWVIQDLENMIDLTFTLISENSRVMSFFFVRAQYKSIFGKLEGVLKTKDGEDIKLDEFPAVGKTQLLRV